MTDDDHRAVQLTGQSDAPLRTPDSDLLSAQLADADPDVAAACADVERRTPADDVPWWVAMHLYNALAERCAPTDIPVWGVDDPAAGSLFTLTVTSQLAYLGPDGRHHDADDLSGFPMALRVRGQNLPDALLAGAAAALVDWTGTEPDENELQGLAGEWCPQHGEEFGDHDCRPGAPASALATPAPARIIGRRFAAGPDGWFTVGEARPGDQTIPVWLYVDGEHRRGQTWTAERLRRAAADLLARARLMDPPTVSVRPAPPAEQDPPAVPDESVPDVAVCDRCEALLPLPGPGQRLVDHDDPDEDETCANGGTDGWTRENRGMRGVLAVAVRLLPEQPVFPLTRDQVIALLAEDTR